MERASSTWWITRSRGIVLETANGNFRRCHELHLILHFDVFQEDVLIQRLHPQLCVPVGAVGVGPRAPPICSHHAAVSSLQFSTSPYVVLPV